MTFTLFDILVLSIIVFFVILGALRGFMKEMFSLIDWVLSSLFTILLSPLLNNYLLTKISHPFVAKAVSSCIIFVILVIGISILTTRMAKLISTQISKSVDVNLGIAFGGIKGFLISSLIFITILSLFGNISDLTIKSGPEWLQNSATYRPLSFGGFILSPLVDSVVGKETILLQDEMQDKIVKEVVKEMKIKGEKEMNIKEKQENDEDMDDDTDLSGGYKREQRNKLDHLIDTIN